MTRVLNLCKLPKTVIFFSLSLFCWSWYRTHHHCQHHHRVIVLQIMQARHSAAHLDSHTFKMECFFFFIISFCEIVTRSCSLHVRASYVMWIMPMLWIECERLWWARREVTVRSTHVPRWSEIDHYQCISNGNNTAYVFVVAITLVWKQNNRMCGQHSWVAHVQWRCSATHTALHKHRFARAQLQIEEAHVQISSLFGSIRWAAVCIGSGPPIRKTEFEKGTSKRTIRVAVVCWFAWRPVQTSILIVAKCWNRFENRLMNK